jgi:hypothetical protein
VYFRAAQNWDVLEPLAMEFDFETLGDIFDATDGFFVKRFRDDVSVRLSVTSLVDFEDADYQLKFSPRLSINKDGSTTGKVKFGFTALADPFQFYQRVAIDNHGVLKAKIDVEGGDEGGHGMKCGAAVEINTVKPPTEDSISATVEYSRKDSYFAAEMRKSSNGEAEAAIASGIKMFNGMLGVSHNRSWNGSEPGDHSTGIGLGFAGDDYAVAAQVLRSESEWTGAQMCILRQTRRLLTVAKFDLDLSRPRDPGVVTMGFEHGMRVRLPSWLRETPLRLTAGARADTLGMVAGSLSTVLQKVRYSVLALHKNNRRPTFGIEIRYE